MELQIILNTIAKDVFRRQADFDYIAARSNYRMKLRQQFLWSALQAIEKYLKAILLFNGKSARYYVPTGKTKREEFRHNLEALDDEVKSIGILQYTLEPDERTFLAYLSTQGGENRYLSTTAYNTADALHHLDRLVWNVRRYCQHIPDRGIGCTSAVPGMQDCIIRTINSPSWKDKPHLFALFDGELERILSRDRKDAARKALVWANLYFGKRRRCRVTHEAFSSVEIPPHEREWPNVDWDAIKDYVKP